MNEKIKPIYFELQGYLSQAPEREIGSIYDSRVWTQHNQVIDELNQVTSKNYDRYKINPEPSGHGSNLLKITVQVYRTLLGGLISRLHGEYFPDEKSPINN